MIDVERDIMSRPSERNTTNLDLQRMKMILDIMATSTGASANFQMAMAVSTSKKLIFGLSSSSIFMSTMATRSLI